MTLWFTLATQAAGYVWIMTTDDRNGDTPAIPGRPDDGHLPWLVLLLGASVWGLVQRMRPAPSRDMFLYVVIVLMLMVNHVALKYLAKGPASIPARRVAWLTIVATAGYIVICWLW